MALNGRRFYVTNLPGGGAGRTFKPSDFIRSGDFEGRVEGIELRHTHIRAADGRDIFIPCYELFSHPLVNFTRDGLRRLTFRLGLDYGDDIDRARKMLLESVRTSLPARRARGRVHRELRGLHGGRPGRRAAGGDPARRRRPPVLGSV